MTNAITPLTPDQQALVEYQVQHEGYIQRNVIALDIQVNVLLDGNEDETLSSRMARWAIGPAGWRNVIGQGISSALNLFQKDHGAQAMAGDLARSKIIAQIETATGLLPVK